MQGDLGVTSGSGGAETGGRLAAGGANPGCWLEQLTASRRSSSSRRWLPCPELSTLARRPRGLLVTLG